MNNWDASTMSPIGLETKHFPTFQQADPLQWETAFPSNNSLLFLTSPPTTATMPPPPYMATSPFDSDPLISHQLQPAAATQLHFLTESTSLQGPPESVTPITDLCTFVKLESGINADDYGICKYGFSGQNFACRSDDFASNLGYRTYFPSCEPTAAMKKLCNWSRAGALTQVPRRCQAEGCSVDLSNGKHYNRRHKVCEFHSKASKVVIQGVVKRFCQQCSRFHVLEEFDGVKRSCRKRLADHNRRRRKSRPPSASESNNSNAADINGGNCESKSDLTDALNHSPPETCSEEDASRVLMAEAAQEAKEASATVKAPPPVMAINNANPIKNKEEEKQALHPHHDQHLSVELLKAPQQQGPSPTFLFIN